jgi:SpoVK/Ycf46/Vps4 family AAA+-type ATPase
VKNKALSALLFGPPGTSKTEIAKALAANLQWPLVEIDPSTFLRNSFQNLYVQAETIFKDVMDMYGVVVLFDELDALVQKRDGSGTLDTESTFLTTYMLPKLLKLHDHGRLIFLMATNFQEMFDDAIKRAGRFDLLLCTGPPQLEEKCRSLHLFLGPGKQTETGGKLLLQYARRFDDVCDQLALYTFGEFKSFVSKLGTAENFADILKRDGPNLLRERVLADCETAEIRLKDLEILNQPTYSRTWKPGNWTRLRDLYSATFDEDKLRKLRRNPTQAVRYVVERGRSKSQI